MLQKFLGIRTWACLEAVVQLPTVGPRMMLRREGRRQCGQGEVSEGGKERWERAQVTWGPDEPWRELSLLLCVVSVGGWGLSPKGSARNILPAPSLVDQSRGSAEAGRTGWGRAES